MFISINDAKSCQPQAENDQLQPRTNTQMTMSQYDINPFLSQGTAKQLISHQASSQPLMPNTRRYSQAFDFQADTQTITSQAEYQPVMFRYNDTKALQRHYYSQPFLSQNDTSSFDGLAGSQSFDSELNSQEFDFDKESQTLVYNADTQELEYETDTQAFRSRTEAEPPTGDKFSSSFETVGYSGFPSYAKKSTCSQISAGEIDFSGDGQKFESQTERFQSSTQCPDDVDMFDSPTDSWCRFHKTFFFFLVPAVKAKCLYYETFYGNNCWRIALSHCLSLPFTPTLV